MITIALKASEIVALTNALRFAERAILPPLDKGEQRQLDPAATLPMSTWLATAASLAQQRAAQASALEVARLAAAAPNDSIDYHVVESMAALLNVFRIGILEWSRFHQDMAPSEVDERQLAEALALFETLEKM